MDIFNLQKTYQPSTTTTGKYFSNTMELSHLLPQNYLILSRNIDGDKANTLSSSSFDDRGYSLYKNDENNSSTDDDDCSNNKENGVYDDDDEDGDDDNHNSNSTNSSSISDIVGHCNFSEISSNNVYNRLGKCDDNDNSDCYVNDDFNSDSTSQYKKINVETNSTIPTISRTKFTKTFCLRFLVSLTYTFLLYVSTLTTCLAARQEGKLIVLKYVIRLT